MEKSKSPKSIAYSRLGKPNSGKPSVPEQSLGRKSTGHIYQELMSQFDPKQQKYLRDLVSKKSIVQAESNHFHNRRKSYADLEVQNSNKKQSKQEKPREERQTLSKTKQPKNLVSQQATPKNNHYQQMARRDFVNQIQLSLDSQTNKASWLVQRESTKMPNKAFLDNLNNYLQQLSEVDQHISKLNIGGEKLSQTLKISYKSTENYKYASKIQQQMLKIKQLKLKNHCIEKQLGKRDKRQKKMKNCLYQMLQEIKQLNNQMNKEKKQRKRLQKVIENFEMRNQKLQRKTIGKNYNLSKIQEFKNKISQFTENQHEKSDIDSSFRQVWKHTTTGYTKSEQPIYANHIGFDNVRRGQLDSNKIQKIFRSNYNSQDDEQDDIYQ